MRLLLQSRGVKMGHQVDYRNLQSNLLLSIVCLHSWEVIIKKQEPKREGPVRRQDPGFRLLLHAVRPVGARELIWWVTAESSGYLHEKKTNHVTGNYIVYYSLAILWQKEAFGLLKKRIEINPWIYYSILSCFTLIPHVHINQKYTHPN